jgi:hypothetical protein
LSEEEEDAAAGAGVAAGVAGVEVVPVEAGLSDVEGLLSPDLLSADFGFGLP